MRVLLVICTDVKRPAYHTVVDCVLTLRCVCASSYIWRILLGDALKGVPSHEVCLHVDSEKP